MPSIAGLIARTASTSLPPPPLALVAGDSGLFKSTTDGITWTNVTHNFGTNPIMALAWSPTLLLYIAGAYTSKLSTSPDGITWTARTVGMTAENGAKWIPDLNIFIIFGSGGKLATSLDGITWTLRTVGTVVNIQDIAWSPALNLLVAVGSNAKIATSPDGITWTDRTTGLGTNTVITCIAWSETLGLFVLLGQDTVSYSATSSDGINWSLTQWNKGFSQDLIWLSSINLFVLSGKYGMIVTSPNGTTWTDRTSNVGNTLNDMAWSPKLNSFIAVGGFGNITTSPDGISWTDRTTNGGFGSNTLQSVV